MPDTPLADSGKTLTEKIAASRERLKAAYGIASLSATTNCPLAGGVGVGVPEHAGNCPECKKDLSSTTTSHSIHHSEEAKAEARRLYQQIKTKSSINLDDDNDGTNLKRNRLFDDKGNMFGVLICVDSGGITKVLKAFSGAYATTGRMNVKGWCPPIPYADQGEVDKIERDLNQAERDIESERVKTKSAETELGKAKKQLRADVEYKKVQVELGKIYRDKTSERDPEKNPVLKQNLLRKEQIETATGQETHKEVLMNAKEAGKAAEKRKQEAQAKMQEALNNRAITNYKGQTRAIKDVSERYDDPRVLMCAAPKLMAEAKRLKWTPVSMAEFWIGKDQGTQRDFETNNSFVPSCEACRSFIGFGTCGLAEQQQAREKQLQPKGSVKI